MKQLSILTLTSVCIIACFVGCNSKNEQQTKNEKATESQTKPEITADIDCSTIANFFIEESKARDLMNHFDEIYIRRGKPDEVKDIVDSFWIDGCVIKSFKKFFHKNSGYDGVRIYSTYKNPILGKNETDVILIPTTFDGGHHVGRWGDEIKIINIAACNPKFTNYNFTRDEAKKTRRKFEKKFRREIEGNPNSAIVDSLSRGIWFSKCVIDSLSKYLEDPVLDLDGVNLHCAAYRKIENGTKQAKPNQSTFLFVLTESDGRKGHKERWDIISQLPWVIEKLNTGGGYNHGELCPTDCPPGEN